MRAVLKFSSRNNRCYLLQSLVLLIPLYSVCWADNSTTTLNDDDGALYLTEYIRSGNITEGRRLSEVHLPDADLANLTSYSGYFTVNETTGSSLFFWFFPAETGQVVDVPLLLWLQGGPGASLGVGLFVEHGPLRVIKGENGQQPKVVLRNETWNREFAQLFIDSPAGTGFSEVKKEAGYATTHQEVSRDLLEALKQFFTVFSEYRGNPFFITGQSYAGKFVPSLGAAIHRLGTREKTVKKWGINLQGFAIGNGFSDPVNQFNYGDFLFATGLIDRKQRDDYRRRDARQRRLYNEAPHNSTAYQEELIEKVLLFEQRLGFTWQEHLLEEREPEEYRRWAEFLATSHAHLRALHLETGSGRHRLRQLHQQANFLTLEPAIALVPDYAVSVKAEVEELLEAGYRALFYAGNLDINVAASLVENFVHNLNWTGGGGPDGQKFYDSERIIYRVNSTDSKVAGYVKQVGNLLFVVVRNAGHVVPYDQPRVALDMITRFVKGQSFKNE